MMEARASVDEAFRAKFEDDTRRKSIDDCCEYIVSQAAKKRVNAVTSEEVEGWAVHYYDEDNLKEFKAPSARVIVPSQSAEIEKMEKEISENEREQLRQQARDKVLREEMEKIRKPKAKKAQPQPKPLPFTEQTLF